MTTFLAWTGSVVGALCLAAFVGGACAVILDAYQLRQDLRQRDADILRTIRPTVDHSPSGPVGDADAP